MSERYSHLTSVKPEVIIRKYGYEYILVEGSDRSASNIRQPCAFGKPNMALKAVRKIKTKI